ncbi:MAG: Lon protease family protein [Anaerofustis sp.]
MTEMQKFQIPVEKLRRACDCEKELNFCESSKDVAPFEQVIGQDRALRAMQFGLMMDLPDYHIFVVGPQGTGKSTFTQSTVSKTAMAGTVPNDWCYIYNFSDPDQPIAVSLPPGMGREFHNDMRQLLEELRVEIPKAFEGNVYEQQKDAIVSQLQNAMEQLFNTVEGEARKSGFTVKSAPPRLVLVPLKQDGTPMPQDEFEKLDPQLKKQYEEQGHQLEKRLDETLHEGQQLQKITNEKILQLEKDITMQAAAEPFGSLKKKYEEYPQISAYLDAALNDMQENHTVFRPDDSQQKQNPFAFMQEDKNYFVRYEVNLFVSNEKTEGAPVIIESNPYYYNIFGKIEYKSQVLAVSTDQTMVKAGSLHRANGGYLIIQISDLLKDPISWDALKKALKYRQITIENIGEQYRLVPTVGLRPEPIPLNVKIVLIGTPYVFEMLYAYDEDFKKLFKVKVDFDVEMPRNEDNICKYVSFVSGICEKNNLLHFDRTGLSRLIEYSSRIAEDQNKLSTRFSEMSDVIYEAATIAKISGASFVNGNHVDSAIRERKARLDKTEEKMQEMIRNGDILIKTEGKEVGQINGLSVIGIGGYTFGMPSRITARTYAGHGGVINVERETEMSGNIHSKGVLILSGFLGGKFAQKKPMGLTAQITFEQNYSGVDGDSASSTELYAILSALSGVPIRQDIAVTGSVDQRGDIQPIGGATHKIEGFFDLCSAKGLTGTQGVMIPIQNIENLMLKDEVLNAVKAGKFHIYAISRIEEGLELLTGVTAGKADAKGNYPRESIFALAEAKLTEYNKILTPKSNSESGAKKRTASSAKK